MKSYLEIKSYSNPLSILRSDDVATPREGPAVTPQQKPRPWACFFCFLSNPAHPRVIRENVSFSPDSRTLGKCPDVRRDFSGHFFCPARGI